MPEISTTQLGGTMRLGDRVTVFQPKSEASIIRKLYGNVSEVHERHRHRYEVNPGYVARLEKAGLQFIGRDEKGERMIILELIGMSSHLKFNCRSSLLCCNSISS
jgi:CTP synthase